MEQEATPDRAHRGDRAARGHDDDVASDDGMPNDADAAPDDTERDGPRADPPESATETHPSDREWVEV